MSSVSREKLRDSANSWTALAAVTTVIGGFPAAVGLAELSHVTGSIWRNAWFDTGVGIESCGIFMLVWAVILFVAHKHSEAHWCPDPEAHRLTSNEARDWAVDTPKALSGDVSKSRSILNDLNRAMTKDCILLEEAIANKRYWGSTETFGIYVPTWSTYRATLQQLEGTEELVALLDAAVHAVSEVAVTDYYRTSTSGRPVNESDRLADTLSLLDRARRAIADNLRTTA